MMKLATLLTAGSLLLARPATAQIAPLRPLVVSLDSGQTIRRPLIGLDTAFYRAVRLKVDRLPLLEYGRTLDAQQVSQLQAELRRCRGQVDAAGQDFATLATVNTHLAALPTARPLLLDAHTYQGAAAGAVGLLLLKLFLHL